MSVFEEEDFTLITDAANGLHGADQERIAIEGLRWLRLLLQKNIDYGSSVWEAPVLAPTLPVASAILVRMSDKVRRIETLQKNGHAHVDESLEDTIRDLGAYSLLYIARRK